MTRIIRGKLPPADHNAAQQPARAIVANAEARARELRERAEQDLAAERARTLDDARAEAARIVLAAERQRAQTLTNSERELTELAVRIAAKLLQRELALSPDAIADVVASCLRAAGQSRRVVIRVNPDDLDALRAALPRLDERHIAEGNPSLHAEADPSVGRGGCVLSTDSGEVDGRLEHQLATIRAALDRAAPSRDPHE